MRQYDPGLELVVCGSSNMDMPTFGAWESEVLEEAWDAIDFVSLHAYYEPIDGDVDSFLASAVGMDRFIEAVIATADAVAARRRSPKRLGLSFDEWNVWYTRDFETKGTGEEWAEAPRLIEDEYSVTDAVVLGSLLISLLRHSDRVTAASLAQLVNVIAPIRSEPGGPAWRQTIFHPFAQTAARAKGVVLRTTQAAPTVPTARYGDAPVVDTVLTYDEDSGSLVLFGINRSQTESVAVIGDVTAFGDLTVGDALVIVDSDPAATNTVDDPDRVVPVPLNKAELLGGELHLELPPLSWATVTLNRA